LEAAQADQRWDRALFGEGGARIVVSVSPEHQAAWEAYLSRELADAWQWLGSVGGDELSVATQDGQAVLAAAVAELAETWSGAIARKLAGNS
jgi:phosphoribosylformylglycinamidine synthase subunit PurL